MNSAWAPFRHRMFAAMAAAAFVSNVGSWMQTVGAQWLMLTLTGSAAYVALVQSAASVPIFLFAVLAGTIGDLVDRRRFLLVAQTYMFLVATVLGVLAILKLVSPWSLLDIWTAHRGYRSVARQAAPLSSPARTCEGSTSRRWSLRKS